MTAVTPASSEEALITDYASKAYLEYAISVVKGRAIPHYFDGLKPGQRRILFAMHGLGLRSGSRHVKSARVVGECLGKYHPHGDQAVYDTMVRMAQPFSLLHPLVDGQGNFGSLEGDAAAAARYTEARLSDNAWLLLDELNSGGIEFVPNYDGERSEPKFLPAIVPILLVNGASGVGVGLACEIPQHNLMESARAAAMLVKRPNLSLSRVMEVLPGPDFPSGGQLTSSPEVIRGIYETGRGSLRVRAKWDVEQLARGQWRLVVTELPPGISVSKVVTEIDALANPGTAEKKPTVAQQKLKAGVAMLVESVRDESDRVHPIRLVVEPKSGKVDVGTLAAFLLVNTSLESTVPVNMVVVDKLGTPRQISLLSLLGEWAETRVDITRKRLEHEVAGIRARLHILFGRRKVLLNLSKVVAVIRDSDSPRQSLMDKFGLDELQADDILDMRLRQLSRLESVEVEKEIGLRSGREQEIVAVTESVAALRNLVVTEMGTWAKKYQQPRRTLLLPEGLPTVVLPTAVSGTDGVSVHITQQGWFRVRPGGNAEEVLTREGDIALSRIDLSPQDSLVLLYGSGRAFSIPAEKLRAGRDFLPLAAHISPESGDVLHGVWKADETTILVMNEDGYGFICATRDLLTKQKAGKQFAGRHSVPGAALPVQVGDADSVFLHFNGRGLAFPISEIKRLAAGGKGVQLVKLHPGEHLEGATLIGAGTASVRIRETLHPLDAFLGKRGGRGAVVPAKAGKRR